MRKKRVIKIYHTDKPRRKLSNQLLYVILGGLLLLTAVLIILLIRQLLTCETTLYTSEPVPMSDSMPENNSSTASHDESLQQAKSKTIGVAMLLNRNEVSSPASYESVFSAYAEQGFDGLVADLKDETGKVLFHSDAAQPYQGASSDSIDAQRLAQAIKQAGMTPIARIHTLKDRTAPHASKENSFLVSGSSSTWLDASPQKGGKPWLNPYRENARQYIVALAQELAVSGFEVIILDGFQFPDMQYRIDMTQNSLQKTEILHQLLSEVQAAVGQTGAIAIPQFDADIHQNNGDLAYGGTLSNITDQQAVVQLTEAQASEPSQQLLDTLIDTMALPQIIPMVRYTPNPQSPPTSIGSYGTIFY